jgi:hypothetical protein
MKTEWGAIHSSVLREQLDLEGMKVHDLYSLPNISMIKSRMISRECSTHGGDKKYAQNIGREA